MRTDKEPNELRRISDWPRRWLEHRYLPWHLAMLAMLLCARALRLRWQFDDDFHRTALTRPDLAALSRSPAELFVFIEGDVASSSALSPALAKSAGRRKCLRILAVKRAPRGRSRGARR